MDTKLLRQKILDLAIRGKLVPQDPNDEPASVLLERIRAEKEQLIKEGKIKRGKKSTTADKPHYENVPFEIPQSWEWVPLSNIFLLNPKNNVEDNTTAGFIPMALANDGFSGKHSYEIRLWKDIKKGYSHFRNGDIGVAKISPCFENLKSVIFSSLPNGIGAGTTELVILRSICVYAPFYLFLFKSQWYISEGTKYFKGVVGQQRVNKEIFTDLKVPMPPLEEQKRIVAEVERNFRIVDFLESNKADLTATVQQTKSKILDLAIHGKLVPQDPADEPAIELLKRINPDFVPADTSHYGQLPNGWTITTMENICSLGDGKKICNKELPYLDMKYFRGKDIEYKDNGKLIPANTTLILVDGENSGETFITKEEGYQGSTLKILSFERCINQEYVLLFIKVHQKMLKENKVGSAIPHLNKKIFKQLLIPIPPIKEQLRIVTTISTLCNYFDSITADL